MKIIQVANIHLAPPGAMVFGQDPLARLDACIADINRNHVDATLCVLSGDLAHDGEELAYRVLRERLEVLAPPARLMIGNHDDRAVFRRVFPDQPFDRAGFVQSVLETPEGRLLFLDTNEPGTHAGRYCERRLAWLEGALGAAGAAPVYLFMHHPPLRLGLEPTDKLMLEPAGAFAAVLSRHRNVRHIFFGHVHRPISGSWRGIPFSTLRGTNHQVWLDFSVTHGIPCSLEPPAYAIILIERDQVVVHTHDFLDPSPKYLYDPDLPVGEQVRPLVARG